MHWKRTACFGKKMKINYLLLAHDNPAHLGRLVSRLNTDNAFFFIHIDKKSNIEPFKSAVPMLPNVVFLEDRIDVKWGGFSTITATLQMMGKALDTNPGDGYQVLLSGACYPVKSNAEIFRHFGENYGADFIQSTPVRENWNKKTVSRRLHRYNYNYVRNMRGNARLLNLQLPPKGNAMKTLVSFAREAKLDHIKKIFSKRKFPSYLNPHGGSQWWALTTETVSYVLDFIRLHSDYLSYHEYTHIPDEIFFQSILSSGPTANRISPSVTHVNWERKGDTYPALFKNKSDFEELRDCGKLFARKFDYQSAELLNQIDADLLHAFSGAS